MVGEVGGEAKFWLMCSGVLGGRSRGDDVAKGCSVLTAALSFKFGFKYAQLMEIKRRRNK